MSTTPKPWMLGKPPRPEVPEDDRARPGDAQQAPAGPGHTGAVAGKRVWWSPSTNRGYWGKREL